MVEGVSLRKICEMPGMPSKRSIFYWLEEHEEFLRKYEIARMMQVEYWSHQIIEIADDAERDRVIDERGVVVVDHEHINRAKLRVDTRKWLMSKLLPKRYGDRVSADVTVTRDVRELSEQELLRLVDGARGGGEADDAGGSVH
jgi:hypothetical protein